MLTPAAYLGWLRITTNNDWQAAEDETAATDLRWRLEQILADREPIPDNENLALAAMRILAPGKVFNTLPAQRYTALFPEDYPANAQLNFEQVKFLRATFQRIGKRLGDARDLRKYTRGRIPVVFAENFFQTVLPDHQDMRILGEWLTHDAKLLAQDDEMDNALQSCNSCLSLGCVFRDDPLVIGFLIQCAMYRNAVGVLERTLAQGEASDSALASMQKRLLVEFHGVSAVPALRGERAGQHQFFEGVRTGKLSLKGWVNGRGGAGFFDGLAEFGAGVFPQSILRQYPDHLRNNTAIVEIFKQPYHERKAMLREHQDSLAEKKNSLSAMFGPATVTTNAAEGRVRGLLLSAAVAVTCERYRLQHPQRTWPKSLDVLVRKGFLTELPRDPIDNQPLRFRHTKDGVVIYSIGPDGKDDDGKIDHTQSSPAGIDIGVQLWDIGLRRQKALPAPAEPEVPN